MTRETVELETGRSPTGSVIWMHGLGADGHDFEPIVPEITQRGERALRFIFPHAPIRPVTINGGYPMRAWYDIAAIDRRTADDESGIRSSQAVIDTLVRHENSRGIASERIVLAGFSQGGAMAMFAGTRYGEKLAGIMGLSCYLLLERQLLTERSTVNLSTPVFLAHGTQDPVVPVTLGEHACQVLQAAGYTIEWHAYQMPHSLCPQEVTDIAAWLRRVLP